MITWKLAIKEDVSDILEVHRAAVIYFGKTHYPEHVLNLWSPPPTPERIGKLEDAVTNPDEYIILAKERNKIAGVGILIISVCRIGMVYVHPTYSGQGVGTNLLIHLEDKARTCNINTLMLDSSLNAETFYLNNGYKSLGTENHLLSSGEKMECILMEKNLT